jgi:hypothetical protein
MDDKVSESGSVVADGLAGATDVLVIPATPWSRRLGAVQLRDSLTRLATLISRVVFQGRRLTASYLSLTDAAAVLEGQAAF